MTAGRRIILTRQRDRNTVWAARLQAAGHQVLELPLIRYEVGDLGVLENRQCECGLSLPMMSPCSGRSHDLVVLPDGSSISPLRVIGELKRIDRMEQYQVVQGADGAIAVNVVANPESRARVTREVMASLLPMLRSAPVRVEFCERIDREPSGKYRRVISECSPD